MNTSTDAVKSFDDDDVIVIEDVTDDEVHHKTLDRRINCCGLLLTSHDLSTLQPSRWLNDQVRALSNDLSWWCINIRSSMYI